MPPEEKSKIEDLKKSLYSREAPDVRTRRKLRYHDDTSTVQKSWSDEKVIDEPIDLNEKYEDNSMSFFTKLLIASIVFCVIAVSIGGYLFFNGKNLISANNIDVTITGPISIPGGEPASFDVAVTNNNSVNLQLVDMSVAFPAGTTDPNNPTQELTKYVKMIGDLNSGISTHETVRAIMFGEENVQKQVVVSLTYGIKGSTAVFTKSKSYQVLINSSPIIVDVSSFKEITSGQEFDLKVNVKSNSSQTLRNILLDANYPFGFIFMSSNLRPVATDNSIWRIGDIPPGGQSSVTVHGKLQGENSDTRSFRFVVGAQSSSNANQIGTQYMSVQQDIAIQKPFLSVGLAINNDKATNDFVGDFNSAHQISVSWFNNLTVPVTNAIITVHLSGNAYDKNSISPNDGYFRSTTNDIIWNQQTTPALASIGAGESGSALFSIIPRNLANGSNVVVNPTVTMTANVSGDRSQESQVSSNLTAAASRNIIIPSQVSLSGRVVRSFGPFINTGPIPPKADQETSYTVAWTVDNTSNSVNNAKVTANLPANVKWLGNVSPSSESVTFDVNTGIVTWNIGNMSYADNASRRREADFQISLLPGVDLVGSSPVLVGRSVFTALDSFTNTQLQSAQDQMLTSFSTDPAFKSADGIVVK